MLDLEAIKKRHLDPKYMKGRTFYEGHIEVDLAALVAEVELLQQENAALVEAKKEGARSAVEERAAERAAVVAWLRDVADEPETYADEAQTMRGDADAIERGEHRREEKE